MDEYDRWWLLGANFEGIQSMQVRSGGRHASGCQHQHQYDKSLSIYETLKYHFCSSKTRDCVVYLPMIPRLRLFSAPADLGAEPR